MGYSGRYHVASLAAVFLALAIGILIGAAFGDDVVTGTAASLERSLQGDLDAAQTEADALGTQLDRELDFSQRAYPALVGDRLLGANVALIGLGGIPEALGTDVRDALEPTGAELSLVAVVREPPNAALIEAADGVSSRARDEETDPLETYGRIVGLQIVAGGALLNRTQNELFSRLSGELGNLDAVILARQQPSELSPTEELQAESLEAGVMAGLELTSAAVVGVERTDADATSIDVFGARQLATVDHVNLVSGQVALILTLLGAEGDYGVKGSADQLLPDVLIGPPSPTDGQ